MKVQSFKELIVWQKGMEVCKQVYQVAKKLPKEELFSLSSQLKRSAISIPSNIAEGYSRNSKKEFIQFIAIANGSSAELETQLLLCKEVYKNTSDEIEEILLINQEIQKMLYSMKHKLKNK